MRNELLLISAAVIILIADLATGDRVVRSK
jgi:hypothetical protein